MAKVSIKTVLWIVAGLAMGPAVGLGLARFAYALLVPGMQTDLSWSYTDAGAMNTANSVGYLIGALIASRTATQFGAKRSFLASLLLTAVSLLTSGLTASFTLLLFLRVIAGITGAVAFVIGAAFTIAAVPRDKPAWVPVAMGIYLGGAGLGIFVSAIVVPPLLILAGWRGGWIILGAASLAGSAACMPALRRTQALTPRPPGAGQKGWSPTFLLPAILSYGLFAAGYIAYMTFIIAYLRGRGFTPLNVSVFWAVLGAASLFAALTWSSLLARVKAGWGIVATLSVVTVGALLPILIDGEAAAFLSALLFGGSFLAVVSSVTSFAGRTVKPHALTTVMAVLTVAFGLGQSIGPILSGAISDGPHGIQIGLLLSAGILLIAAIVAAFQHEPKASD